jgi:primosomal replication protein N
MSLINRASLMSQMKKRPEQPVTPDGIKKINIFASILKASSNNPITTETDLINEEDQNNPQEID